MEKFTLIFQAILGLTFKDDILAVPGDDWDNLVFHNQSKGEYRNIEIEKWRDKIFIIHGIMSTEDPKTGYWYFKHRDRDMYVKGLKALKA